MPTTTAATPTSTATSTGKVGTTHASTELHPLDPATASELEEAVRLISERFEGSKLQFHAAGLIEPPKPELRKYLSAERAGKPIAPPPRKISLMFYMARTPRLFEADVDVTNKEVARVKELDRTKNAPLNAEEVNIACAIVLGSDEIKKEMERLNLSMDKIVADPWDYCRDTDDEHERKSQVFFYARNPDNDDPESNPYAFPLDFLAIVDLIEQKLERVAHLPLGLDSIKPDEKNGERKLGKPIEPEYAHHLQKNKPRTTMTPLRVVQPEGPSFCVEGNLIEWEKWRFRVGFNWREGMVLYDITFDGRELFHRISLAEMFVPYGEPRSPLHRKAAFDLGNHGAGYAANNLGLGCDCLGVIKYFDADMLGFDGKVFKKENVICLHEVDAGIQWKHTNWRTGQASVVRRRQLQLQTIITVANYEYAFYFNFDQSGEIMFDTLATGILSTTPIDPTNKEPCDFGTRVADGVFAPYHQHIFSLRIDPCIDGDKNSLQVVDSVPMPRDEFNPHGIGYRTEAHNVKVSGTEEIDVAKGRVFKMINPNKINPTSLAPVGYKLVPIASQKLLADPDSWHGRRGQFCQHPIWVTKYKEGELFPAGDYTNQSNGDEGIRAWVDRKDNVDNEDIVVWHTYAFTHNPRPEDFPVMPAEVARVMLKPNSFFEYNPALDVPPSKQSFNQSTLYDQKPSNPVGSLVDKVADTLKGTSLEACCKK